MNPGYRNVWIGGTALALTALALPGVGQAASPTMREARERCAQAIGMQLDKTVVSSHADSADPLDVFQRPSPQIRLYVYDARSGAVLATGICRFDPRDGHVVGVRMGRTAHAFTLQNLERLPP